MRLYFVRHAESVANLLHEISNRGWRHGLTPKGRGQAYQLGARLSTENIVHIFSSPLMRAVETADILAAVLQKPVTITDALREYDCGEAEGRSDPEAWEMYKQVVSRWHDHNDLDASISGGESFNDTRSRFLPWLSRLLQRPSRQDQNYAIISHGGLYVNMLPLVLNNIDPRFPFKYDMLNTSYVLAEQSGAGLVCLEWAGYPVSTSTPDKGL